jgi:orotidine-5'-phosphate decarboxylase
MRALAGVIQHARRSGVLVLLDGKRGDIGSTAEGYAAAYLGASSPWGCDALTVNPYLGDDTLVPFVQACKASGGGIFVLVKTSNPGSGFLQDLDVAGRRVYQRVAECVEQCGSQLVGQSGFSSVGAVVGATYPEQLAELRAAMPHAWILIPGYGAQGGTADDVRYGFKDGSGAVVNSSRGIIFAFQKPEYQHLNWQEAVYRAASDMREQLTP